MRKKIFLLLLLLLFSSCVQKEYSDILYKGDYVYKIPDTDVEKDGKYIEGPDGKIVRSLRNKINDYDENEDIINNQETKKNINQYYKTNNKNIDMKGYYKVVDGDNLWEIAKKHNMSTVRLAEINDIKEPYIIKAGDYLKVEDSKNNKENISHKEYNLPTDIYIVKSGDNFSSIANKYDMSIAELANLNPNIEAPYNIKVGEKIKVSKNASKSISKNSQNTIVYTVKSGDNLSNISSNYDVSFTELVELNNLKEPYTLYVGDKLKIPYKKTNNNLSKTTTTKPIENKSTKPVVVKNNNNNNKNDESFMWPIKGNIISSFGNKSNGLSNDGINISANEGTEFKATNDGLVVYVGNELRGYGVIILVKHSKNWISVYAHCNEAKVSKGDKVYKGQVIGTVGKTGNVTTPQLYFSLRKGREAVDPTKYLKD